jgi:putative ABC transport system permease protein
MLLKSPGFTFVAILALALGIGANTSLFSVVNAVLLRPLPVADPDRLIVVKSVNEKMTEKEFWGAISPADFFDWQAQQQKSFSSFAAYSGDGVTLNADDAPERFTASRVTGDFFKTLGVTPLIGRAPSPDEFTVASAPVVVLSHALWQRRFGGDPGIVGRTLTFNNKPTTVIGVMPPEFKFPIGAEVWRPQPDTGEMKIRGNRYFTTIARLKPDATIDSAQAELAAIAKRLEAEYPKTNAGWSTRVVSLRETLVGDVRPTLWILFGAVGFVLLIACANVANLLLARAAGRGREVAIRTALGATRGRIVRQLLTESLLLALIGGALGVLLAVWGVEGITSLVPADWRIPRLDESRIDMTVLGFTLLVSIVTGLMFGLIPGLKASRPDLNESLKETGRSATSSLQLQRTRSLLIIAEIALTLLLLVGAGLLIKSFLLLNRTAPGFETERLLVANIGAAMPKYADEEKRAQLYTQIIERIEQSQGIKAAALNSGVPLAGFNLSFPFKIEGRAETSGDQVQTTYSAVSPNYFRVMNIPVRAGREFTQRDTKGAPEVAIINETMARRYFPDGDAIGKRLTIDYLTKPLTLEVVGIAADVKNNLSEAPGIEIYTSHLQHPWFAMGIVVRTEVDPASAVVAVQRAIRAVDSGQAASGIKTMEQLLSEQTAQPRFYTLLLTVFAGVALLLAAIGVYAVVSYSVAQRTHEIGIRMALGAERRDVLRLVVGQSMKLALAGVTLGVGLALLLTRVLSNLLYGVSTTDPVTFGVVVLLSIGVALCASYLPARRAMKVDPMIALRYE